MQRPFQTLPLEQVRQLYAELGAILEEREQQSASLDSVEGKGREVVDTRHVGDRLYQLERVRCGKVGCKCAGKNGDLHGPYWYAYWREDGRMRSQYVGKRWREIN